MRGLIVLFGITVILASPMPHRQPLVLLPSGGIPAVNIP
jgi:hypothetical protein